MAKSRIPRRQFLKAASAAGVGGAAITAGVPTAASAEPAAVQAASQPAASNAAAPDARLVLTRTEDIKITQGDCFHAEILAVNTTIILSCQLA